MAVEFALIFLLGVLPLLLLTVSGVLIFAAKQSLTLAASEGARAALRFGVHGSIAEREVSACLAAKESMQWLLAFSGFLFLGLALLKRSGRLGALGFQADEILARLASRFAKKS